MKVSDLIIYIMNIMWRDFKKIRSSRFRDVQKSDKSPNFEWSCTYKDRKNENTPKFPSIYQERIKLPPFDLLPTYPPS